MHLSSIRSPFRNPVSAVLARGSLIRPAGAAAVVARGSLIYRFPMGIVA